MRRFLSVLLLVATAGSLVFVSPAPAKADDPSLMRDMGIGVAAGVTVVEYEKNREAIHEAIANTIKDANKRGKANHVKECARRTRHGGCKGVGDLHKGNRT